MENINKVIHVSANELTSCKFCIDPVVNNDFEGTINHYITHHGYKLLHVGTETTYSTTHNGLWHSTVAVLGE